MVGEKRDSGKHRALPPVVGQGYATLADLNIAIRESTLDIKELLSESLEPLKETAGEVKLLVGRFDSHEKEEMAAVLEVKKSVQTQLDDHKTHIDKKISELKESSGPKTRPWYQSLVIEVGRGTAQVFVICVFGLITMAWPWARGALAAILKP